MKNIISITLALPLLLALPTGMSACATTRMAGEQTDDARIKSRVGRRLSMDPDVKRMQIDVDVLDSVVTLRGKVDNSEIEEEALRIAQNTKGVDRVVNQLEVVPGGEDKRDGDVGLKTKIGTQLMADPDVRRFNIDVDVIDGVVYLSGVVHDQEAKEAAERIASNVDGVVRVQNELTISADDDPLSKDKQVREEDVPVEAQPPGEHSEHNEHNEQPR
ncbi:MAG TPA: BON domain-containing protein [Enhygromyxa sp.]|nr:BON domain-containing protein [Enhygromyxa sp.]